LLSNNDIKCRLCQLYGMVNEQDGGVVAYTINNRTNQKAKIAVCYNL